MRWPPALVALALAACGGERPAVPAPTARPVRVMSINLCTDQFVLALLPPERIASVSWLARDPSLSLMAAVARGVPVNHGAAEEVVAERPDLVVADTFASPRLRAMLRRLGYPLVEVAEASDLAGIRRSTRQVARAVGEPARGERLIAAMDARLAALARRPAPPVAVALWDRSGVGGGAGTLTDVLVAAAGARNVAAGEAGGRADLEALLRLRPALLLQGRPTGASLGDDVARHRLVRRLWRDRTVALPSAATTCGTPMIGDAAAALRDRIAAAGSATGYAR